MIIESLHFSGIGPFRGESKIDFAALCADGLFLFDGPTGSGKSTLIDAITFALFGDVAGKSSSNERIRSTHSAPDAESWVDLVFTVSSGTYRVRRTPAWNRLKRSAQKQQSNATGIPNITFGENDFRKINETAKLWRIDPAASTRKDWENGKIIATQVREVRPIIEDLIGLTKDQFLQTVVLPQGQFAEFLRLKSAERQPILEAIFRTKKYREFTNALADRAKESLQRIANEKQTFFQALDTWLTNQGLPANHITQIKALRADLFTAPNDHINELKSTLLDAILAAQSDLAKAAKESAAMAQQAQLAEDECRAKLAAEEQLFARIAQRIELEEKLAILQSERPEHDSRLQALALAAKASVPFSRITDYKTQAAEIRVNAKTFQNLLEKYFTSAENAKLKISQSTITENFALCTEIGSLSQKPVFELSALQLIVDKAQKSLKALLENQVKLQQKITHFAQLKELETTTQTTADRITQLTEQLAKIRAERAEIGSEITQIPLQKAAAMQALADATEKSSKLLQLEKELAHLLEISKAFTIRKEAEAALAIANSRLLKAAQKLHKIKSEYQETLRRWQKSFAADLAQELSTGSACPVCGATEHPAPAESTQKVSAAQVEQAQEKLDRAHHAFNDATVQQQACEITVAKLSEQTTNFAEHKIKTDISTTREMITAAQNAESEKAAANEKITLLSNQLADLTTKDTQLALTEKAAATELTLLTTQVTANEKTLAAAKDGYPTIKNAFAQLKKVFTILDSLIEIHRFLNNLLDQLLRFTQLLHNALEISEFADISAVEAAQLSATQALELTRKVKAYEENLQSTQSFLQDPLITATKGKTPPDLEIRKAELAAQIENRQRLAAKSATTSQFVKDAKLLYSPIRKSATAWEQIIAESKAIIHLADLATAHNRQINRVPLDIWVLMRRFEAIVTRANMHLQEISNGRYELIRSEEGGRVKKTGLGLSIIDRDGSQLGDITRSTTSLSGGETFYTSLALALALAEIVQEESGGVRIDTLIIDEGFGTLSAGIRDLVLHTLHDLQKNGRKIGIVSHVPELKQLIANRIAITAEKSGESTIQVIC